MGPRSFCPPPCLVPHDAGYCNKDLSAIVNSGAFWDLTAEFVGFKAETALLAWIQQQSAPEYTHIHTQYQVEQLWPFGSGCKSTDDKHILVGKLKEMGDIVVTSDGTNNDRHRLQHGHCWHGGRHGGVPDHSCERQL